MGTSPLAAASEAFKALAHPARLRILAMLGDGELCVCQITAVLGLAYSTVSAHLAELRAAALIDERRQGKWVHYRLAGGRRARRLRALAAAAVAGDEAVRRDAHVLRRLRGLTAEELCRVELDLNRLGIGGEPARPPAAAARAGGRSKEKRWASPSG